MRSYELILILQPDLQPKELKKIEEKVKTLITSFAGKVKKVEFWGKKELAYPIKKHKEGLYWQFRFKIPQLKIKLWENKLKMENKIIRYLLVKIGSREEP